MRNHKRHYRNGLTRVQNLIANLNANENVAFMLQLGDLIDGYINRRLNQTQWAIQKCVHTLEQLNTNKDQELQPTEQIIPKVLHVWGNHEMHALGSRQLYNSVLGTARLINNKYSAHSQDHAKIE